MKKFIFFISLCVASYAELVTSPSNAFDIKPAPYEDFGVHGREYKIMEENILHTIMKKAKNFSLDSKDIEKKVKDQVAEAATESTTLPLCLKTVRNPSITDYSTVREDIHNPLGRLIYKKGQKVRSMIKAGKRLDLCFIDSRNDIAGANQITNLSKENPTCIFLVANKDVRELRKKFPKKEIFPTSISQEQRFEVPCYPTVVNMEKDQRKNTSYSYDQFKN